ncbi:hypothetical protein [Streptomyces mirabilis]|uniref:hypothetical protein n=1 Tax=Streptomyces mirabilis TaxID=68239 RepID=UPI00332B9022
MAEVDIATWVPEPVAWEWAQHVAADWDTVRVRLGDEAKAVKKAGLTAFESPYVDVQDVAENFLAKLAEVPHVVIIPLSAENARKGLRDQILQRPPGRKKEGTKTGASDSAWLRDTLDSVDGDVTSLLFVSEDGDLRAALESWDMDPPLMRALKDLLATLFKVTADTGAVTPVLLSYIFEHFLADHSSDVFEVGVTPKLQSAVEYILDERGYPRVDNVAINRITQLVGVLPVVVEEAEDSGTDERANANEETSKLRRGMYGQADHKTPHTAMATLMLLADAEAAVSRTDADDRYVTSIATVSDILLRVVMVFDLRAGKVTAVRAEGEAEVFGHHEGYDSGEDALSAFVDAITDSIPGVQVPDGWPYEQEKEFQAEVNGHYVRLGFSVTDADAWEIEAQVDGEVVELGCAYDVGHRAWLGREDSFDWPGAYQLSFSEASSSNPIWALAAWIIERLYR